ncbi:hypothetical protein B0A48_01731 [Cryoendolithus antarcticus]|uniref:Copper homeostasis protein cutC homolog n=1 Tax=Cryoendolithus antarcticus TaxID=1507870 RepID=A0A1V8TQM3_9PEZI|nr:hypothetical protein B0A48_01731 [Cryoendolithus antarcticus]
MIRPRGGDFVYSLAEYSQMVADVARYKPLVDGFVFGILTTDVDEDYIGDVVRTRNLVVLAAPLPCTFHRAFDEITHRMAALDDVVQAGCTSVLTSGGATTAVEGTNILHDLVSRAEGSLNIIAGGGLRSSNVIGIVATTGVKAVHSSAILDDSDLANAAEIAALKAAVADALLKLKVPQAGFLPNVLPIPRTGSPAPCLVAPISTILFVDKNQQPSHPRAQYTPAESNIPSDKHWTDCPTPGTVVLMQQADGQLCALLGDIVASRLKHRGVKAAVIHGRSRDIAACRELCNDGKFQVWSKGISTVGTSMEAKPWVFDVPLHVGGLVVNAGDIIVADEAERGITIVPADKLEDVMKLLPGLKEADDNVLKDVNAGIDLTEAFKRHRGHYANAK